MNHMTYPFTLEPLPYSYNALEPAISEETLHFHHDKHLQTYVDKLNAALKPFPELHDMTLEDLLAKPLTVPGPEEREIKNNGGGVYNHTLMFRCYKPYGESIPPEGPLMELIQTSFSSFESFMEQLIQASMTVFGSGYGWLVKDIDHLKILHLPNQDNPLSMGLKPLLPVDVWEHAYYLQYQNRRIDYLNSLGPIMNWEYITTLL